MGKDDDKKRSSKKDSKKDDEKKKKDPKKDDKKKVERKEKKEKKDSKEKKEKKERGNKKKSDSKKESKKDDKKKSDKKDDKKAKKTSKDSKRKDEKHIHKWELVDEATIQRISASKEDLPLPEPETEAQLEPQPQPEPEPEPQLQSQPESEAEAQPEPEPESEEVEEPEPPAAAQPTTNEMKEKKKDKKKKDIADSDDDSFSSKSKSDDEMDDEMKALMEEFAGSDSDSTSSSSSSSDSSEDVRSVELNENLFDHIVLAASDIEAAIEEFTEKTGVVPRVALAIKGLGIKVARVSFEGPSFLEIIAPDPESGGPIGNLLRASGVQALKPFHWAIRTSKTDQIRDESPQFGYVPDNIGMAGARKDGTARRWEMTYLYGHKRGGICPFFINWDNSDHPCETMPIVGDLIHVKVSAPEDDPVHKLIDHTGSEGFTLVEGSPAFEIKFDSPEGEVTFGATKMTGFKFPGFTEECGPIEGEEADLDIEFPTMPELNLVETEDYEEIPKSEV